MHDSSHMTFHVSLLSSHTEDDSEDSPDAYTHRWIDATTLEARLPHDAFNPLYAVARSLGVQMLALRTSDCTASIYHGNFTIRVSVPGIYRLHLSYPASNGTHVLANDGAPGIDYGSKSWEVHGCGDVLVQEVRKIEVSRREEFKAKKQIL